MVTVNHPQYGQIFLNCSYCSWAIMQIKWTKKIMWQLHWKITSLCDYVIRNIGVCPFQKSSVNLLWNKRHKRKVINLFNSLARASHATADNTAALENRPRRGGMLLACFTEENLWNICINEKRAFFLELHATRRNCQFAISFPMVHKHVNIMLLILIKISNQNDFHFRTLFTWCSMCYNEALSGLRLPLPTL